jgi:hypothetical protein
VNSNEAKTILLLYRPGSADAEDPQIAEALRLAKADPELARWLGEHCARQEVLRGKFRKITAPAGLKEQIISEHAAVARSKYWRPRIVLAALAIMLVFLLLPYWPTSPPNEDTFAIYREQMAGTALRGYGMDLTTNDPVPIRAYLAQNKAPADYVVPAGLAKAPIAGCAIEGWQNSKVSMICFRTGRPLPPGQASDMWLFVADRAAIPDAPEPGQPRIIAVNELTTAVWVQGGKVYMLGLQGDESTLRKFL